MAETENGYIKLYRSMLDWEWYKEPNTFKLFVHLLFTANVKPHKWKGIEIKRGQCVTSIAKLSEKTGLSESQVRTSLNRLISTNSLTNQSTARYRIITVNHYDYFQGTTKSVTNKRQTDDKLMTNYRQQYKNDKNDKKEKNEKNSISNGASAAPQLPDILTFISENHLRVDGREFYRRYSGNGWKTESGKAITDWQRMLTVWDRHERESRSAYANGYAGVKNLADD